MTLYIFSYIQLLIEIFKKERKFNANKLQLNAVRATYVLLEKNVTCNLKFNLDQL